MAENKIVRKDALQKALELQKEYIDNESPKILEEDFSVKEVYIEDTDSDDSIDVYTKEQIDEKFRHVNTSGTGGSGKEIRPIIHRHCIPLAAKIYSLYDRGASSVNSTITFTIKVHPGESVDLSEYLITYTAFETGDAISLFDAIRQKSSGSTFIRVIYGVDNQEDYFLEETNGVYTNNNGDSVRLLIHIPYKYRYIIKDTEKHFTLYTSLAQVSNEFNNIAFVDISTLNPPNVEEIREAIMLVDNKIDNKRCRIGVKRGYIMQIWNGNTRSKTHIIEKVHEINTKYKSIISDTFKRKQSRFEYIVGYGKKSRVPLYKNSIVKYKRSYIGRIRKIKSGGIHSDWVYFRFYAVNSVNFDIPVRYIRPIKGHINLTTKREIRPH